MENLKIFVVDDDGAVREALRWTLESCGYSVEVFDDAEAFLEYYHGQPGCLILDMAMPGMSGLELQKKLEDVASELLPIIFISAHGTVATAVNAMRNGAIDFLMKPFNNHALVERVIQAMMKIRQALAEKIEIDKINDRLSKLTARERSVLEVVVSGSSNKEIARTLGISIKTVETHRANIMAKTCAGSLAELVRLVEKSQWKVH